MEKHCIVTVATLTSTYDTIPTKIESMLKTIYVKWKEDQFLINKTNK